MQIRCRRHREQGIRLLQVAFDKGLRQLVQRPIRYNRDTDLPVPTAWEDLANDALVAGIYCRHCLTEGLLEPLDVDPIELECLGEEAHYFHRADAVNVDEIWPEIQRRFKDQIVGYHDVPGTAGIYLPPPPGVPSELRQQLGRLFGDKGIYRHQAHAVEAALGGTDVVVSTPTASGKSLCYVLPVLSTLLKDPKATAIYVAPTQALAEDQFDQWLAFSQRKPTWKQRRRLDPAWEFMRDVHVGNGAPIIVARYDGGVRDTDGDRGTVRRRIRGHSPRIVITTPESLHAAILGQPDLWATFLRGLRYVILDEMHSYRGLFGASMAQVIRRVRRTCDRYSSSPTFIGCSATIRNPDELGRALLGTEPKVITRSGSPRRRRRFVIIDSTKRDEPVVATARRLIDELVRKHRLRTIAFARSVSEVDHITMQAKLELKDSGMSDLVTSFKADLPPQEKRDVAASLKSGVRAAVVTTNALELGVDIGELSAAVLVKFPGSVSSVLQQAGRAGRRGEGFVFLLADASPLNQFFVHHPSEFFEMIAEEVYIDPKHAFAVEDHLVCAAYEEPIDPERDQRYWGADLPGILQKLVHDGRLIQNQEGRYIKADDQYAAKQVGLRNQTFFDVPVMHQGMEVTRVSGDRAPKTLHKYARFKLQEALYEVSSLRINWENKAGRAEVRMVLDRDYLTAPLVQESSNVLATEQRDQFGSAKLSLGSIQLNSYVHAYFRLPIGPKAREEERTSHQLGASAPPPRSMETQSTWITFTKAVVDGSTDEIEPSLQSVQKALVLGACVYLRCDPGDLGGLVMPQERQIFLYDTQRGGSGISAKVFEHFPAIWEMGRRVLADCPFCSSHPESRGCPKCVTDEFGLEESIDRGGALDLFERLTRDVVSQR